MTGLKRLIALLGALVVVVGLAGNGQAAVSTDRWNYQAGDTVQITGDGMLAGETVGVDVSYPDASLAQHHDVSADTNGSFSDAYTIKTTDPNGIYTVTATGASSGKVFMTTFDPNALFTTNSTCLRINGNIYPSKDAVYLNGGPTGPSGNSGLDPGLYYVKVTDPSGAVLLGASSGTPITVTAAGKFSSCLQLDMIVTSPTTHTLGFDDSPNSGTEYKVWISMDPTFANSTTKTDNFKVVSSAVSTTLHNNDGGGSIATDPNNPAHVNLGTSIYDTANVTAGKNIQQGSSVTFHFFTGGSGDCKSGTNATVAVQTSSGIGTKTMTATSAVQSTLHAGTYAFDAVFTSSDTTLPGSTSACEPFVVDKGTLTIVTTVRDAVGNDVGSSADPGEKIHDTTAVTAGSVAGIDPSGTVTYTYHDTSCSGTSHAAGSGGGIGSSSAIETAASPGGCFEASYIGDLNYNVNPIATEPFTVSPLENPPADPTVSTTLNSTSPLALGGTMSDTVTVSAGVGIPQGSTVHFKLFSPSTDCLANPQGASMAIATNSFTPNGTDTTVTGTSVSTAQLTAGSYSFQAVFTSGDPATVSNNNNASPCEPFSVNKATPGLSTTVVDGSGFAVSSVPINTQVHDIANLTGVTGVPAPTGSVTFSYGPCAGALIADAPVGVVVDLVNSHASSAPKTPSVTGQYCFNASYGGDSNYNASAAIDNELFTATSSCTPAINMRWHYSAGGSGSWSATKTVPCTGTITFAQQGMEGDLKVKAGTPFKAGYDFTIPGKHPLTNVLISGATIDFAYTCPNGGGSSGDWIVSIPDSGAIADPANSSGWYPSGDQSSTLVYQLQTTVPTTLCGSQTVRIQKGGTFTAHVSEF